jgi:hypothetical protein
MTSALSHSAVSVVASALMPVGPERRVLNRRYYFPVIGDGSKFEDDKGRSCPARRWQRLKAAVIAAELAQDGAEYRGFLVCAVDDEGNEVVRVPVVTVAC